MTKQPPAFTIYDATDLRQIRKRAGWSQQELAARAGIHVQTVKYWESERPGADRSGAACRMMADAFTAAGVPARIPSFKRGHAALQRPASQPPTKQNRPANPKIAHRCGAKTRKGSPCQMKPQPGKRRCALHGGLSTGPATDAGRARIAEAQRARWAKHREEKRRPGV
jgi:transcriptional regulator with XRE-family HTH domain